MKANALSPPPAQLASEVWLRFMPSVPSNVESVSFGLSSTAVVAASSLGMARCAMAQVGRDSTDEKYKNATKNCFVVINEYF